MKNIKDEKPIAIGAIFGLLFGIIIGISTDKLAVWGGPCIAIGAAFGSIWMKRKEKKNVNE